MCLGSFQKHKPSWWEDMAMGMYGHITSAVKKQRKMDAGAQLAFYILFSLGFQPMASCYLYSKYAFTPQILNLEILSVTYPQLHLSGDCKSSVADKEGQCLSYLSCCGDKIS